MPMLRFDVGNVKVTGYISSVKSSEGETFRVVGVCPVCNREMKVGYGMGKLYGKTEICRIFRNNAKNHIKKHK